jgi:hypothetical protein
MNSCTFFGHSEEPPCRHCQAQHDPAEEMQPEIRQFVVGMAVIATWVIMPDIIRAAMFGIISMTWVGNIIEKRQ